MVNPNGGIISKSDIVKQKAGALYAPIASFFRFDVLEVYALPYDEKTPLICMGEQPIRACKNCGRYFAIAGRISTEYCDRLIDSKGHTLKSMGSINQWNVKRKDDAVFKVYRREYKKRFGWIKAGKIEQDIFYRWSEKAREEKAECDNGEISLQEFEIWLKEPY